MTGKIAKLFDEITNSNVPVVLCGDITVELEQSDSGLFGHTVLFENTTLENLETITKRIDELLSSTCVFIAPKIKIPGFTDTVHISIPLINNHESARNIVSINNITMQAYVKLAFYNDTEEIGLNIYLYA